VTTRYSAGMTHYILKRGRYWEEYASVPGKRGKKRFIAYHGTTHPDARREQMLATADRKADEIAAWQRAEFGESGEERAARVEAEARFSAQKFLEGTTQAPLSHQETVGSEPVAPVAQEPSVDCEASTDASSKPSSEPDAGASEG
jgi:hypothetical protein